MQCTSAYVFVRGRESVSVSVWCVCWRWCVYVYVCGGEGVTWVIWGVWPRVISLPAACVRFRVGRHHGATALGLSAVLTRPVVGRRGGGRWGQGQDEACRGGTYISVVGVIGVVGRTELEAGTSRSLGTRGRASRSVGVLWARVRAAA